MPKRRNEPPQNRTSDYSRAEAMERYSGARRKRGRRKGLKVFLIVLGVVAVLASTAAWALMARVSGSFGMASDSALHGTLTEAGSDDPFYMVLIGIDKDEYRSDSSEYGSAESAYRTDSILLARVDPTEKQVTLVSIHRDTLVDFGTYGKQKINSAYSIGAERKEAGEQNVSGASYTVETISKFAGVPISHYAEIDFDGFMEAVDALGGVEVDVPMEINDEDAGGHLDAGLQTLNGDQALILCRARHAYDAYGDGDRYRAANQRLVLSAVAKKILSSDPITMANTIQALSKYITTDFNVTDIVSLASSMQGLNTDTGIYSAMEPTTSKLVNGTWYEYVNEKEWQTMMQRVDQGLPPTTEDEIDEKNGTVLASTGDKAGATSNTSSTTTATRSGKVAVKNGANIDGAAATAATKIEKLGYTTETGNASSSFSTTVVVYTNDSQKEAAEEIVKQIGNGVATKNDGRYMFSTDFLVVIGSDWK